MKQSVEKRKPFGLIDYFSLAITTFGVGYLPIAPGTWGSMVGVLIYVGVAKLDSVWVHHWSRIHSLSTEQSAAIWLAAITAAFIIFTLAGIWASSRATGLLGNLDPSEAVVDEVIGQLIVFLFVPFAISWPFILAGFLLFRLFDIWKPYPIHAFEALPGGLGICADDIVAGVYAGICLAVIYAASFSL